MKIYDIVVESKKLVEFSLGDAGPRISTERVQSFGLNGVTGWQTQGSNESAFAYSEQSLIGLLDEAMTIFGTARLRKTNEEIELFKDSIMNFLSSDRGKNMRNNISRLFSSINDNQDSNNPIKHNEALGLMLNMIFSIVRAAEQAGDPDEEDPTDQVTPAQQRQNLETFLGNLVRQNTNLRRYEIEDNKVIFVFDHILLLGYQKELEKQNNPDAANASFEDALKHYGFDERYTSAVQRRFQGFTVEFKQEPA